MACVSCVEIFRARLAPAASHGGTSPAHKLVFRGGGWGCVRAKYVLGVSFFIFIVEVSLFFYFFDVSPTGKPHGDPAVGLG